MSKQPAAPARRRRTTKPASPPTIDTSKLSDQLKELRLPTFRENHQPTAEQAARAQWTHMRFLAELVEQECQARSRAAFCA